MAIAWHTRAHILGHCNTGQWLGRLEFITLFGGAAITWSLGSHAQQQPSARLKRIGLLSMLECQFPRDNPARRRFAELGWIEGHNFVLDCVSMAGRSHQQLPEVAHELVLRHPDVLLAVPYLFVLALKQETTTIPIVMLLTPDPVRSGLVTNLARPESNVTGVAWFGYDLIPKRIELLRQILPELRRFAFIGLGDQKNSEIVEQNLTIAGRTLGFDWQQFRPVIATDYDAIFAHLAAGNFDAAYIQSDTLSTQPESGKRIVQLALRHRLPTVGDNPQLARDGLLLSYAQDFLWSLARGAEYVDKILRGASASDLPVEQATKLELVINLKTAKTLGITVPPSLLARADEVIE